jgi:FixJ family two-component response regulator
MIALPMRQEPNRSVAMNTSKQVYVAVVDDDDNFCRSLGRLLRAAGMQPIMYASAEAFLADTKHPRFDCLLLDVHLGGMSGIELGRRLASEGRQAPFICITALDDPEVRAGAEAAGCAAFFRKTESGTTVLEAIRRVAR